LMDTGVQLGRRFRALKLWFVLRWFGVDGLAARLREHVRMAQWLAAQVDAAADFERLAPAPFSVVCLRACPAGLDEAARDALNERMLEHLNGQGEVFLSHTKLHDRYAIRVAIGNLATTRQHVERLWALLQEALRICR